MRPAGIERATRCLGGLVALAGAVLALPGVVASARAGGRTVGQPEAVLTAPRLAIVAVGWFSAAILLWRPLPWSVAGAGRLALTLVGAAAYFSGFALAIGGRLALGSSYRVSSGLGVKLAPGHRLVVSGPYAVVRHPMYLGLALAALGALFLYRTWATAFMVAQLPALLRRARLEDRALAVEFGAEWQAYRLRVPGWLPRLPIRMPS